MVEEAPENVQNNILHLLKVLQHPGRRPAAVPFEQAARQGVHQGVMFTPGSAGRNPFMGKAKPTTYNNKFLVEHARRQAKTHGDVAEAIIRRKPVATRPLPQRPDLGKPHGG
jgi:hypothetical protein